MAKYTKEQLAKMQEEIKRRKQAEADAYKKSMFEKSAIFRTPLGIVLKVITIISIILSSTFMVDHFLDNSYTELKIQDSEEDIVNVIKDGNWHIPVKYFWVSLGENKQLRIHMFHGDYELAEVSGKVEIGHSPIFKTVTSYKVTDGVTTKNKNVDFNFAEGLMLPGTLLFISVLWILMKPEKNFQFIVYGYFSMFVIPILLILLMIFAFNNFNFVGVFEMNIQELDLGPAA
jgi:hypothetical protein